MVTGTPAICRREVAGGLGQGIMNKLLALFLMLGAIGGFGMSQRENFQTQSHTWTGEPVGEPRVVQQTRAERAGYFGFGLLCMIGCIYFIARIRNDDLRR